MEKLSQLMDGELDPASAREALARLKRHEAMRENWDMFHLIRDAMQGEETLSPAFGRRFAARLAVEPTVLAPARAKAPPRIVGYALSAAASLAAVALVGWLALGTRPVTLTPAEIATAPVPATAQPAPEAAPRVQLASEPYDGSFNGYLMAHTGFSPTTAIQGVAPYIRALAPSPSRESR